MLKIRHASIPLCQDLLRCWAMEERMQEEVPAAQRSGQSSGGWLQSRDHARLFPGQRRPPGPARPFLWTDRCPQLLLQHKSI